MIIRLFTGTCLLALFILACNNLEKEKDKTASLHNQNAPDSIPHLSPVPEEVMSADILFFKKPFEDSTRYTRFFKSLQTSDTMFMASLRETFRGKPGKLSGPKNCLSEGKIIIPLGGDAFKVFYFSRQETGCPYVYFIVNGEFLYYEMPRLLNQHLNRLEEQAEEK